MARNSVQFQKGLGEAEFHDLYGSEEQCQAAVFAWRWPQGFVCPDCGGRDHRVVKTRGLHQCAPCRRQTSLAAGTIFAASKLPRRTWFRAMYHLTQGKGGISSLELARRLGVTQTTAWKLKHKLMQVMMERDAGKRLTGRVEMDDAYLGGERSGGKRGRGSPGKTPIVAAVETTPEGQPVRLKPRRVAGFRRKAVATLARRAIAPESTVVTDGLACFRGVADAGGLRPPADPDRVGPRGGADTRLQVGQHGPGQHQVRDHRHLPGHPGEARPALPRPVRIPLQPTLRPRRHDAAPRMGRRPNPAHAIPPPQAC